MGILQRIFTNSAKKPVVSAAPKSFLECFNIIQNWSAKVAVDPDFDMNDKDLHIALDTLVTCPYCSANIRFGDAVQFQGARVQVQCPACHTITKKEKNYEYGGV
ncbi:MAG: hypothetical protein AMJ53_10315 [Gammaproteobacteria bacterium SG8_11]|nr:MAG: hypothetical protein AMJ53_10315 [Gammaproteobacteria bacterium SG8_11]